MRCRKNVSYCNSNSKSSSFKVLFISLSPFKLFYPYLKRSIKYYLLDLFVDILKINDIILKYKD